MTHHLVSVPLSNDGYFFARAETVGSSPEELDAAERGRVDQERVRRIATATLEAMKVLSESTMMGRC